MTARRIEGLPFLPGNTFVDVTKQDFRRSHTFSQRNGYNIHKDEYPGIGECHIPTQTRSVKELFDMYSYDPALTYGMPREKSTKPVIPSFVALEKKTLKFLAYTKETVTDCPFENHRVRHVSIYYYLEDDSIMVSEPKTENSGLMQGKFLRRHKIPKNNHGDTWHWKDLNIGCDIAFYGRVYRIVDCDAWTKSFYGSEGIVLNDPEEMPSDGYIEARSATLRKRTFQTPDCMMSKSKKYLEYLGQVLKYKCIWDDRDSLDGCFRRFELYYHLQDDTVEVSEIQEENSGRDPFKLLLHRIRLPKNYRDIPMQFPSIYCETTAKEYVEYYEPKDFYIGATINVFGRRFLIYDMHECTKEYYASHFGVGEFQPISVDEKKEESTTKDLKPPPWNGWGSPEDSLESWLHIVPRRPRRNVIKSLVYELKLLKYGAIMDSTRPEDIGREFTISYRLVNDTLSIFERPVRNSGWPPGKFLDYCQVIKPGSSKDNPEYYGPADFYVGAMLDIHGFRFLINSADRFVLDFIRTNPECFPEHVRKNIEEYFECEEANNPKPEDAGKPCDPGAPISQKPIGEGFFELLGLSIQRSKVHPCVDNPNPCPTKYNWDVCKLMDYDQPTPTEQKGGDDIVQGALSRGDPDMFEPRGENAEMGVYQPERLIPIAPPMENPDKKEFEPIPMNKYYDLKNHRFDAYNPDVDRLTELEKMKCRFMCPEMEPKEDTC